MKRVQHFKVKNLPVKGEPDSIYYLLTPTGVEEYVTDRNGDFLKVQTYPSSVNRKMEVGVVINGGKAVMCDTDGKIYPFNIANPYHYDKYIGVAQTSTNYGDLCTVVISGENSLIGSGWTKGTPYYIGSTSFLTSTPPTSGWVQQVGVGIDENTILIIPQKGIELI